MSVSSTSRLVNCHRQALKRSRLLSVSSFTAQSTLYTIRSPRGECVCVREYKKKCVWEWLNCQSKSWMPAPVKFAPLHTQNVRDPFVSRRTAVCKHWGYHLAFLPSLLPPPPPHHPSSRKQTWQPSWRYQSVNTALLPGSSSSQPSG